MSSWAMSRAEVYRWNWRTGLVTLVSTRVTGAEGVYLHSTGQIERTPVAA